MFPLFLSAHSRDTTIGTLSEFRRHEQNGAMREKKQKNKNDSGLLLPLSAGDRYLCFPFLKRTALDWTSPNEIRDTAASPDDRHDHRVTVGSLIGQMVESDYIVHAEQPIDISKNHSFPEFTHE
jgi:hypothetical protein